MPETSWHAFEGGKTLGTTGSERGTIFRDEEHEAGSRITLERDTATAPFAITCGIYGLFFHTCYFGKETEALDAYHEMKAELGRIISLEAPKDEAAAANSDQVIMKAVSDFVDRFPT